MNNLSKAIRISRKEQREISSARLGEMKSNLTDIQNEILMSTPHRAHYAYARALSGNASLRQAIKAKCMECVGFEDYVNQISSCSVIRCPLLKYRPYQKQKTS